MFLNIVLWFTFKRFDNTIYWKKIIYCVIDYKKSEQRSVNAEVKETIQELQECIEVQKQTFTDLQNEYLNYQVVSAHL